MNNCIVCGSPIGQIPPTNGNTSYFLTGINENTGHIDDCNGIPLKLFGCIKCGSVFLKSEKLLNCSLENK
ncbi:hypothetical protein [Clostridium sp.]|uniref:hypothetical protein n=1 Tax=Clostridium sp. TaxID=1506 RepID=UPI001EC33ED6|nr:hypothetical protein [Clostridium sp.]MBS5886022.1 hypothetical protein [Clostridium sp.]